MSPMQNLWLTFFSFGPAIVLGIYKEWWVGLLAITATFILSWILTAVLTVNLSLKAISVWAWVKPPIISSVVLFGGWSIF